MERAGKPLGSVTAVMESLVTLISRSLTGSRADSSSPESALESWSSSLCGRRGYQLSVSSL